jgi:ABC-type Zn uptake system ZnuABC Zn-binding protein ZnuA
VLRRIAQALAFTALATPAAATPPLRVVATIEPLCMLAREIGGDELSCTTLVPAGATPHAFEPRVSTLRAVADAELLVAAGNGIDDWTSPLASAGSRSWLLLGPACGARDLACAHFWLDPELLRAAALRFYAKLAARDAGRRPELLARVRAFLAESERLDREVALLLAPFAGERFVSFHPAWGGFASHYGLVEVGGIQERGAEEPTPRSLAAIVDAARGARVRVVVVEPQIDPHTALALAGEIGARVARCDPLGDPGDPARATTFALRRWNAGELAAALAGGAP